MVSASSRAAAALQYLDASCPREEWVRVGMAAKSAGLDFDTFHHWSESAANYQSEKDCRTAWKSFSDSGAVTAATLFAMAKAQGWQDLSNDATPRAIAKPPPHPPVLAQPTASDKACEVWAHCIPATPAEPYIDRKRGKPDGLCVYPTSAPPLLIQGQNVAGYLVVPCWHGEHLQTLQFIPPEQGKKLNLTRAAFNDGFFTVGQIGDRIYVVEGIGQAWAVNHATGCAAVVCFGAGRMMTVAQALRRQYPALSMVVVPDKGKEAQAVKIAAEVSGESVAMPDDKPNNYDVNDYLQEVGAVALRDLLETVKTAPLRYTLLSDDDLCKLPPLQWRIKKVLPENGLAACYGASGSGKSFLILDALQSLAAGGDWFDYKTKPCHVLYCALEGESGVAGRVSAYRIRHGTTSPNIRYLVQSFNLLDSGDMLDLAQAIKANRQGADVIVLDTLNRAASGADENDSKSMGQIIAASKQLQTIIGGLVILVHHTGKDASKGLRGHSSLHAALDAAIEVRRDGDRREWVITKSKDGEDGTTHPFRLDIVELGTDEDGEAITSCVVQPMVDVASSIKNVMPPKSGNQRIIWDALGELFRQVGNARPKDAPDSLPHGRPCLTLETAIHKTRTRLVCDTKRQTERTKDAITRLVNRGLLHCEAGFIWCK